jgi:hypothetical protein
LTKLTDVQKQVDPCKQFTNYDVGLLLTAMGQLPNCINLNGDDSLLFQMTEVCNVVTAVCEYELKGVEVDRKGTHFIRGVGEVFAIGLMSRVSNGDYEAIYYYADGMVIVEDRAKIFRFYMKG